MKEKKLLKDKFGKYPSKTEEFEMLNDAIRGDLEHKLDVLLCKDKLENLIQQPDEYSPSNRRHREKQKCKGGRGKNTEPIICKCMFYYDRQNQKGADEINASCQKCPIISFWANKSKRFKVVDYEYPMPYKHTVTDIKRVDLLLKDVVSDCIYAVEVKRQESNESLSRMMAEALTYTAVLEKGGKYGMKDGKKLLPAIAFFDKSSQQNEYMEWKQSNNPLFEKLIKEIKVFKIKISKKEGKLCEFEYVLEE